MKRVSLLLLLILTTQPVFCLNSFVNTKQPSVDFKNIIQVIHNQTSIESFKITIFLILIDVTYDQLLKHQIIGNEIELEMRREVVTKVKQSPAYMSLAVIAISFQTGLKYSVTAAGMNFVVENLYSLFFNDSYWKERSINFIAHLGASYLLTALYFYRHPNLLYNVIQHSTEVMTLIFIFQNYGIVAMFTNLALSDFVIFCRWKYMDW